MRNLAAAELKKDILARIVIVGDLNAALGEDAFSSALPTTHSINDTLESTAEMPLFFDAMHDAAHNKPGRGVW